MSSFNLQLNNNASRLNVLQLTDSHLFAEDEGSLLGVNTAASFKAVLSSILNQEQPIDFIIMTGDISQDYSLGSYQRFARMISVLNVPVFFVPGNHDDGPLMYRVFQDYGVNTHRSLICKNWHFVFLNSEVYGVPHGWIERSELSYLKEKVEQYPYLNTVVVVHHLPLLVNSRWLDTQTMHNQEDFNGFVSRYPNIKLVLSGHVHQEFDRYHNNIRYIATPSTSIQFEPLSQDFALDLQGPGWRYLQFDNNGTIDSQVYRLPAGRFVPDTAVGGY